MNRPGRHGKIVKRSIARLLAAFVALFVLPLVPGTRPSAMAAPDRAPSPRSVRRSSSSIALTTDGSTLLVVNPDSNSLSLVDTNRQNVLAEIPVGRDPRTVAVDEAGQRAYTANRGSNSVSVVDLVAPSI
jgi:YVTN family beta-propeller protein